MILQFENRELIQLALRTGAVPARVAQAALDCGQTEAGQWLLVPKVPVPRATWTELQKLGVQRGAALQGATGTASCWAELWPLSRQSLRDLSVVPEAALFVCQSHSDSEDLIRELLRLGHDEIAVRLMEDGEHREYWLRVTRPPYYTLLRAEEFSDSPVTVYLMAAPRVWVQWGWEHPLADSIQPKEKQMVLLSPDAPWRFVAAQGFEELYPRLQLELAEQPVDLANAPDMPRWSVPLHLAAVAESPPAELWMLDDAGQQEWEHFVQTADSEGLAHYSFAVVNRGRRLQVILRSRAGSEAATVREWSGTAFTVVPRLPQVYVPSGTRLSPPIRREWLARLLRLEAGRLACLRTRPDGAFTTELISESAFCPAGDWIDYVLDQSQEALIAWERSVQFNFDELLIPRESAAESDVPITPWETDSSTTSLPDPSATDAPSIDQAAEVDQPIPANDSPPAPVTLAPAATSSVTGHATASPTELTSGPAAEGRISAALEAQFLKLKQPLESARRFKLWRDLARAYAGEGQWKEAAACWRCLLWHHPQPRRTWWNAWFLAEQHGQRKRLSHRLVHTLLQEVKLRPAHRHRIVTQFLWSVQTGRDALEWRAGLASLRRCLELAESTTALSQAWWYWLAWDRCVEGDLLSLTQARDRLLGRLFRAPRLAARDLPTFLRLRETVDDTHLTRAAEELTLLQEVLEQWRDRHSPQRSGATSSLAALVLAYAWTRLKRPDLAQPLIESAAAAVDSENSAWEWIQHAYQQRIREIERGTGAVRIEHTDLPAPDGLEQNQRYAVDRLRQQSRILEPWGTEDVFRRWQHAGPDDKIQQLGELATIRERDVLQKSISELLAGCQAEPPPRAVRILSTLLKYAPRLGDATLESALLQAGNLWLRTEDAALQLDLLESALPAAARLDQPAVVQVWLDHLSGLCSLSLDVSHSRRTAELIRQLWRPLRGLGFHHEVERLLERIQLQLASTPQSATPTPVRSLRLGGAAAGPWDRIRADLAIAAGWWELQYEDRGWETFQQAQAQLLTTIGKTLDSPAANTVAAVCETLGHAAAAKSGPALRGFLSQLPPVQDSLSTNSLFSLNQIIILESAVLALLRSHCDTDVSREKWVEEEEFLLRRRIHRDFDRLSSQG